MLHRKELTRSPIQHLFVLCKLVDGLLTRQLFDSLVFVFVPAGTVDLTVVVLLLLIPIHLYNIIINYHWRVFQHTLFNNKSGSTFLLFFAIME